MAATTSRTALLSMAAAALAATIAATASAQTSDAPPPASRPANGRETIAAWVIRPKNAAFVAPNRPVWHIADIVAQHRGQSDWEQTVIKDTWFVNRYVSMGPGKSVPTSFQADSIIWFVVQSGQIRFNVRGQEPFVAGPDAIVQIPMRTPYSMETVGSAPSVRFEVRIADAATVYPVADNPAAPSAPPGFEAVKVNFTAPARTGPAPAKLMLDYDKEVVNAPPPAAPAGGGGGNNFFVRDPHGFAVPIRSAPATVGPNDIGHFHTGLAEFWYVLEGDMDVRIEGVPGLVHAHHGDVVYAPMGRYHRTIMVGAPMSTRLAMGSVTDSGASFTPITTP